jgi:ubiquinone biosynthesis protein
MRQFQYDLGELIEDYATLDISEASMAEMVARLQKIMFDYQISVPGSIFLIFRAFSILEGIGKQIHPHFNTYEFIKPYGKKIVESQFSPKYMLNELSYRIEQATDYLESAPREFKDIITKVRKGKIHFEIEHQGYGHLLKKLDSVTNRIAMSLVITALIIGSSITMTIDFPAEMERYNGIPYISLAGLYIAGFMFLFLLYYIIRRRKYK